MILFPYERSTIKTSLTPQAVQQRLSEQVEPRQFLGRWFWANHKPYEGEVNDEGFTILRIIYTRNSFRPVIQGKIQPEMGGCLIKVTMRPSFLVLAFVVIWGLMMCIPIWSAIYSFFSSPEVSQSLSDMALIPVGIAVVISIVMLVSFKIEAYRSKRFLLDLFDGQEVGEDDA